MKLMQLTAVSIFLLIFSITAQNSASSKSTDKLEPAKIVGMKVDNTAEPGFKIEKFACGTGIEDRELIGESDSFPDSTSRIYCWSLITGCPDSTSVDHVWFYSDKEIVRVTLDIKFPRVRTWSYKSMIPEWSGDWRVELQDNDGNVLAATEFKLQ